MKESISKKDFINAMNAIAESVYDFHQRWNLFDVSKSPFDAVSEREELLLEEVRELIAEYSKDKKQASVELLSREAADVLYVSIGSMLALHKDGAEAMLQVAKKNNNKTSKTHFYNEKENKVKKLDV
ncbi:MAG: hypothetical protein CL772_00580 [Chloroflexi bacterium]|nr:hypothetical protein [Chloroflexota bacterium]MBK89656.1 hypothetical protein [Chloroflexota bacterium]